MEEFEGRGSVVPPGQVDLALFLATLPQLSEYDCGVELDQLTASGLNHIARETGKSINDVAKDAAYLYLRLYFMKQDPKYAINWGKSLEDIPKE